MEGLRFPRGAWGVVAGTLLLMATWGNPLAMAGTPFGAVVAANPADYAGYQVKITYTGIQTIAPPGLLLAGSARLPEVGEFAPHQTPGINYGNDEFAIDEVSVAGSTIEKIVNAIATRPELQIPGGTSSPTYSLMIERGSPPGEIVFEHLATPIEASEIATILQGAVRNEPQPIRDVVTRFKNRSVGP